MVAEAAGTFLSLANRVTFELLFALGVFFGPKLFSFSLELYKPGCGPPGVIIGPEGPLTGRVPALAFKLSISSLASWVTLELSDYGFLWPPSWNLLASEPSLCIGFIGEDEAIVAGGFIATGRIENEF